MRLLTILMFFCLVYCVTAKNTGVVKALTESMGQEVIEIGTPVKELPQDIDEEPSAEVDDEDDKETTLQQLGTRKDGKKNHLTTTETRRMDKDIDKIDRNQEDEEARIEKELAEIYKDNVDYKADSAEITKETNTTTVAALNKTALAKPIARARTNFKFQPDGKEDVEQWRTSIDEITCDKSATKKLSMENNPVTKSASSISFSPLHLLSAFSLASLCR